MKALLLPFCTLLLLAACPSADDARIVPIPPQNAELGQALTIALSVNGSAGPTYSFALAESSLDGSPGFQGSWQIIQSGGLQATFRWTPTFGFEGTHSFRFVLTQDGQEVDDATALVTVGTSRPRLVSPIGVKQIIGAEPSEFLVRASDPDSLGVNITLKAPFPPGLSLDQNMEQQEDRIARLSWDGRLADNTSNRFRVVLLLDDGESAVEESFWLVLSSNAECSSKPPTLHTQSPIEGETVVGSNGYRVEVGVRDDTRLDADAVTFYYGQTRPPNGSPLELSGGITLVREEVSTEGNLIYRGSIPTAEFPTDRDSVLFGAFEVADGSLGECRNRTATDIFSFTIQPGGTIVRLEDCSPCSRNAECVSGLCALDDGQRICATRCSSVCSDTCRDAEDADGAEIQTCGSISKQCGFGTCDQDTLNNNSRATAYTLNVAPGGSESVDNATICSQEEDFYELILPEDRDIDISLLHGLENRNLLSLELIDESGSVVSNSDEANGFHEITFCSSEDRGGGPIRYARVTGFNSISTSDYLLDVTDAGSCCLDTHLFLETLTPGATSENYICDDSPNVYSFELTSTRDVELLLAFDSDEIDLDLTLQDSSQTPINSSAGTGDFEMIEANSLAPGLYYVLVQPYLGRSRTPYAIELNYL